MNTQKKISMVKLTVVIIFLSGNFIFAQTAGNSGLSFLKFGFGARNIAMGDAGNAVSNDVTSLFYNPAKLAGSTVSEIMFMHNEWIQDVRSEVLGVRSDIFGIPLAFGFNVSSVSDIEVRTDAPGEPLSKFNANFFFGSISTGFNLTDDISTGVSIKYIYEGIYVDEANGYAFDIGVNYKTSYDGLIIAGVIRNLGSMNNLRNEATKLPVEFRLGPAYNFGLEESKLNFVTALELQKYTATDDIHLNAGLEMLYDNIIAVRAGYQSGYESRNFTAGIGLKWGSLGFDYAFLPFSLGLGSANLFSLKLVF